MMIQAYSPEIESKILNFYNSLSEKDRRRYAAIEATKLGYGGVTYIRSILHCDDRTITRGLQELNSELSNEDSRIRQPGAGQKLILDTREGLENIFYISAISLFYLSEFIGPELLHFLPRLLSFR